MTSELNRRRFIQSASGTAATIAASDEMRKNSAMMLRQFLESSLLSRRGRKRSTLR